MGKKITDEDMLLNIKINGDEAKSEFYALQEAVRDLNSENNKLEKGLKKYNTQIEKNEKSIAKYTATIDKQKLEQEKQTALFKKHGQTVKDLEADFYKLSESGQKAKRGMDMQDKLVNAKRSYLDAGKAANAAALAVKALEKKNSDLAIETNKLTQKRDVDTASLNKNKAAITESSTKIDSLRKNLDLTSFSLDDLSREITEATRKLRQMNPNDPKWNAHNAQLQTLNRRYAELRATATRTGSVLGRMATSVNKYWAVTVSFLASFVGLMYSATAAVQKFAGFEDILSDTQKTTGLAKNEVKELNENLKKIDNRTAQAELQGLAKIGGKLGVKGLKDVEGFVRAADQINVALSEDLGGNAEEAIGQVGKLVDIFKIKDEFGIEQGMLKVGSVINELGSASTANEGYIVEFSKRVAGVGANAGISINDVMGLGATLDQFGQQAEASSSVYTQMMSNMFKNTAEYASVAGMSVSKFSKLMNTDANEAFISVLEGLKGNNEGMETLVNNLGDMELNGVRATSILGTLADNTATLRDQQNLANQSFIAGTSLTNEFNVKNHNAAAVLEKQVKVREDLIVQLGEKLYPLMVSGNNIMNTGLKVLGAFTTFLIEHGASLVKVTLVIGAYVVGVKLQVLWNTKLKDVLGKKAITQKLDTALMTAQTAATHLLTAAKALLSGNIKAATVAIKLFSTALRLNPLGIFLTVLTAVGYGLYKLVTYSSDAEKAIKRVNDAHKDFEKTAALEDRTLKRLFGTLSGTKEGTKEWAKARKEITDKYGQYLSDLGIEINTLADAKKAYEQLSTAIRDTALEKAKTNALNTANETLADTQIDQLTKIREEINDTYSDDPEKAARYFQRMKSELEKGGTMSKGMTTVMFNTGIEGEISAYYNAKKTFEVEKAKIDALFTKSQKTTTTNLSKDGNEPDEPTNPTSSTSSEPSANFEAQIIALKESYAAQKITKEKYEKDLDDLELAHLQYRLANFKGEAEDKLKLQGQIADKQVSIRDKYDKSEIAATKQHDKDLDKVEKSAKERNDEYMQELNIRMKNTETAHKMELAQLKIQQNEELAIFTGTQGQRKELQEKHALETLALSEKQATDMVNLLNQIFVDIDMDEIDLGEVILSDEQKLELEAKIVELKKLLSELNIDPETGKDKTSGVDILGMSSDKWMEMFDRLKEGKLGIEDLASAVGVVSNAWSMYSNLRAAQEKKELKQFEEKTKKEKLALDRQLESGAISQEQYTAKTAILDAELDTKKEEIEKKQAERAKRQAIFEATMALAVGLVKLWASPGFPAAIPMALVLGTIGAVQIATIAAAQYEKGKYPVVGADDGRTYNADYVGDGLKTGIYSEPTLGLFSEKAPEMVVDGATTKQLQFNYPQIYNSIIDVSQGRVPQYAQGKYPSTSTPMSSTDYPTVGTSDPAINRLLQKTIEALDKFANKPLEIPWYGSGSISEKMKKATKYEKQKTINR